MSILRPALSYDQNWRCARSTNMTKTNGKTQKTTLRRAQCKSKTRTPLDVINESKFHHPNAGSNTARFSCCSRRQYSIGNQIPVCCGLNLWNPNTLSNTDLAGTKTLPLPFFAEGMECRSLRAESLQRVQRPQSQRSRTSDAWRGRDLSEDLTLVKTERPSDTIALKHFTW